MTTTSLNFSIIWLKFPSVEGFMMQSRVIESPTLVSHVVSSSSILLGGNKSIY
jgi:hypothetical protein